jgi:hypothetical protein
MEVPVKNPAPGDERKIILFICLTAADRPVFQSPYHGFHM